MLHAQTLPPNPTESDLKIYLFIPAAWFHMSNRSHITESIREIRVSRGKSLPEIVLDAYRRSFSFL